jgi:hypothetical protein
MGLVCRMVLARLYGREMEGRMADTNTALDFNQFAALMKELQLLRTQQEKQTAALEKIAQHLELIAVNTMDD